MNKPSIVTVDWNEGTSFSKLNARPFFEKCYPTGLNGRGFVHASHRACEYPDYCCLQHAIVVYLRPEHNSVRRISDSVKVEKINYGDVAIVPAYIDRWRRVESETSEKVILTIEPDLLSDIAQKTIGTDKIKLIPSFARSNLLIQSIALNIKAELDSDNYNQLYVESLFNTLIMYLLRNQCIIELKPRQPNNALPPHKLTQALSYIDRNLDENIKINDIAELLGISQYYFCRLFHQSTGVSPYRYVIQQRITRVKKLIKKGNFSLSDISLECGFSSQSQMTHHFRKLVGITPKTYRDRL